MSEPVVLINVFEVPAADAEQFVAAWEKTRDYLQRNPAHLDTALHQALGPDADFQFVNIAHWRSAEEFTEAVSSPGFREASAGLRWRLHPALYRVARTQVDSP
jgi:heme-degrading monooxygenase HmoA